MRNIDGKKPEPEDTFNLGFLFQQIISRQNLKRNTRFPESDGHDVKPNKQDIFSQFPNIEHPGNNIIEILTENCVVVVPRMKT